MTPLLTALSSFLLAVANAVAAASLSPVATAARTRRTCVLSSVLTALLRSRAFSLVPMRLIWDLMFATYGLSLYVRRSDLTGLEGVSITGTEAWGYLWWQWTGVRTTRADTRSEILAGQRGSERSRYLVEQVAVQDRALAPDLARVDP